ncbi:hypothetical protein [Streptomyces sp. NPDC088707]
MSCVHLSAEDVLAVAEYAVDDQVVVVRAPRSAWSSPRRRVRPTR